MPKFNKTEEQLETLFDKWLFVLRNLTRMFDRPAALQERVFNRLFESAEISKLTQKQLVEYEDSLKAYRDWKNTIHTAHDKGKAEGRQEGEAIGLEKGEAIGIEKGKAIGLEKGEAIGRSEERKNLIKKMLNNGASEQQICQLLDITPEVLQSLIEA